MLYRGYGAEHVLRGGMSELYQSVGCVSGACGYGGVSAWYFRWIYVVASRCFAVGFPFFGVGSVWRQGNTCFLLRTGVASRCLGFICRWCGEIALDGSCSGRFGRRVE